MLTSIGVTRELNRHRVNSIAEQSTRYCNYAKDKEIQKIIATEKFLFSDDIYKKNKFGFNQTRQLILTDLALYNLKGKKPQRRLDISKLKGITVSIAKGCLEFVIHGNESEHDYLYSSKHKYTIIYLLEIAYEKLRGRELDFISISSAAITKYSLAIFRFIASILLI